MRTLAVAEIFGPTIQGEGPSAGRRATFLRLGGCNLSCSWCDTPFTWDASRFDLRAEITRMSISDVLGALGEPDLLVVTGGEPLLQAAGLGELLEHIDCPIEVETNGTLPPPSWAARFNVSPKLPSAGHYPDLDPQWLEDGRAVFKFVVTGPADLPFVSDFDIEPHRVWIMPEGTTAEATLAVARSVADEAIARGWNLTLRNHVLLWGQERGR